MGKPSSENRRAKIQHLISNSYALSHPNYIFITNNEGISTVGDVSLDTLNYIRNTTGDIQQQLNDLEKLSNNSCNQLLQNSKHSNKFISNLIENSSNFIENKISSLTLDEIPNSSTRKSIDEGYYYGDLLIEPYQLNVSNLNYTGITSSLESKSLSSSNLDIVSFSLDNPAMKISHSISSKSYQDCIIIEKFGCNIFNVKKSGNTGINKSLPTEKLDIVGDVKFSGKINEITSTEFSYLRGLNTSLQKNIDNNTNKLNDFKYHINQLSNSLKTNALTKLSDNFITGSDYINYIKEDIGHFTHNTSNNFVNTKQNVILFDKDFEYDINKNKVSVKNNIHWIKEDDGSLTYDNRISVYSDCIKKHIFDFNHDEILEYSGTFKTGDASGVLKHTDAGYFTYYWSSSYTYASCGFNFEKGRYKLDVFPKQNGKLIYNGSNYLKSNFKGEYIIIRPHSSFLLTRVKIHNHKNVSVKKFKVYGSDNKVDWTELDYVILGGFNESFVYSNDFSSNTVVYRYYGICINQLNHKAGTDLTWRQPIIYNVYLIGKKGIKKSERFLLQSQFDTKQDIITGAASTILSNNLEDDKILVLDENGKILQTPYDKTKLEYINTLTGDLQSQIDEKKNDLYIKSIDFDNFVNKKREDASNYASICQLSNVDNLQNKIIGVSGDGLNFDGTKISFTREIRYENDDADVMRYLEPLWRYNHSVTNESYLSYSNVKLYDDKITITKEIDNNIQKEYCLLTNIDLELKQDLLTFSSNFLLDSHNKLKLISTLWQEEKQNISYGDVTFYDNKIRIGKCQHIEGTKNGQLYVSNIITNSIKSLTSDAIKLGDNIEVYCDYNQHSICSKGNIWIDGSSIIYTSDERIKKNIEDIYDDNVLQKLSSLQPKKYEYIDSSRVNKEVYGFISQQVKEIIPEATSTTTSFIPNIYQFCNYKSSSNVLTGKNESIIELPEYFDISVLTCGNNNSNLPGQLKLKNNYNEDIIVNYDIMKVNNSNYCLVTQELNKFSVNSSNIFVYGTQVNDLIILDNSYLFTLNVCANQEINRKLESLQSINSNLLLEIDDLERELSKLENIIV